MALFHFGKKKEEEKAVPACCCGSWGIQNEKGSFYLCS